MLTRADGRQRQPRREWPTRGAPVAGRRAGDDRLDPGRDLLARQRQRARLRLEAARTPSPNAWRDPEPSAPAANRASKPGQPSHAAWPAFACGAAGAGRHARAPRRPPRAAVLDRSVIAPAAPSPARPCTSRVRGSHARNVRLRSMFAAHRRRPRSNATVKTNRGL